MMIKQSDLDFDYASNTAYVCIVSCFHEYLSDHIGPVSQQCFSFTTVEYLYITTYDVLSSMKHEHNPIPVLVSWRYIGPS